VTEIRVAASEAEAVKAGPKAGDVPPMTKITEADVPDVPAEAPAAAAAAAADESAADATDDTDTDDTDTDAGDAEPTGEEVFAGDGRCGPPHGDVAAGTESCEERAFGRCDALRRPQLTIFCHALIKKTSFF